MNYTISYTDPRGIKTCTFPITNYYDTLERVHELRIKGCKNVLVQTNYTN